MKMLVSLLILISSFSLSAQEAKVLIKDSVRKVISQEASEKVIFNQHAGIYYLKADVKNYDSIKSALQASQKSGATIHVKADATTLEIIGIIK